MEINIFNYTITIRKKKRKYVKRGLNSPAAPYGYVHRWVRQDTVKILTKRDIEKTGYALVKANKYRNSFPVIEKGRFKGHIGLGGLILAKIPKKILDERRKYYEKNHLN
tara:strand:+ start:800 stop:1126 length:327 start_codon:yes stop_codon:yes gene_type:complete